MFTKVKQILFKHKDFRSIVPIPKARTPIIKFIYSPTNISCDIAFNNALAVHNSRLIKLYLCQDPRFRPTMMILKFWISNYELNRGYKMSKYFLILLFIFYLQQPAVRLVPPIMNLKRRREPEIVEGWPVYFDEKQTYYQPSENSKNISIPDLLHGFFEFYSKYDFEKNVICPIDGFSHDRSVFSDVNTIPKSMQYYKEYLETIEDPYIFRINKPMCLQDLHQLNHNVTGNIQPWYLEMFQKFCTKSAELLDTEANNNYGTLLPSLFSLKLK